MTYDHASLPRSDAAPRQIVFISGCGHSGSTLLDMCLGGHSAISSLGETGFLSLYANQTSAHDLCTCGKDLNTCSFWTQVAEHLETPLADLTLFDPGQVLLDDAQKYRDRMPDEKIKNRSLLRQGLVVLGSKFALTCGGIFSKQVALHRRIAQNRQKLYQAVFDAHKTPIIVDSSKSPGVLKETWITRRFPTLYLRLVRDGRAVCASRMRRLNVSMEQAVRFWKTEHKKEQLAMLTVPQEAVRTFYYEEMVKNPKAFLNHVCALLGVDFEDNMLDFRTDRHNIGGNPMRFRSKEREIKPDQRWRQELTSEDLDVFHRIGGKLNASLGYAAR